jgi:hypothetical protein
LYFRLLAVMLADRRACRKELAQLQAEAAELRALIDLDPPPRAPSSTATLA